MKSRLGRGNKKRINNQDKGLKYLRFTKRYGKIKEGDIKFKKGII